MKKNSISVIIPTKDRYKYLPSSIRSCLDCIEIDEIIISDNSEFVDQEFLSAFSDSRLKYHKTPESLSMPSNFEYGLSKATSEYIMTIGDDDGLIRSGIEEVKHIIESKHPDSIVSASATYHWGDFASVEGKNSLDFELLNTIGFKESSKELIKFLKLVDSYTFKLPGLYGCILKRDIIEKIKKSNGRFWNSNNIDSYSAISGVFFIKNYYVPTVPFWISGASGSSNGDANIRQGGDNKISRDFKKSLEFPWHPKAFFFETMRSCAVDSYMHASEIHGIFLYDQYFSYRRYAAALTKEINIKNIKNIQNIINQIKKEKNISWTSMQISLLMFNIEYIVKYLGVILSVLTLRKKTFSYSNLTKAGVFNINDASKLVDHIIYTSKYPSTNLILKYLKKLKYFIFPK